MRVVAGTAGGRRLKAPKGDAVRPTSDMVRQAIFNSLGSLDALDGAAVLDLFAGTGALGIEALSRGASRATFVEQDPAAVRVIHDNVAATGVEGATVVREDVLRFLARLPAGQTVDVAFADPPYAFDQWDVLLEALAPLACLVVTESDRPVDAGSAWEVLKVKRYGGTVVTLIAPRSTSPKGQR